MTIFNGNKLRSSAPERMTAEERLNEAASILAKGVVRLQEKQKKEKIQLDKSPTIRPYGHKSTLGEKHE